MNHNLSSLTKSKNIISKSLARTFEKDAHNNQNSEWIEINLSFEEFQESGLSIPGTLVATENGTFLIGDTNPNGGACECCPELSRDIMIERYKIIWDKEEEGRTFFSHRLIAIEQPSPEEV